MDTMLNFPANIEEMLTNMYGDFMELPPEDKLQNPLSVPAEILKLFESFESSKSFEYV